MSDIKAPPSPALAPSASLDVAGEQPTLTDIQTGEQARPVRAPAPSPPEEPGCSSGEPDRVTRRAGQTAGVLRVDGTNDRGYRLVVVSVFAALVAVLVIVVAVRSFTPPHSRYQPAQVAPAQATRRRRVGRSDPRGRPVKPGLHRTARGALSPVSRPGVRARVCVVPCGSVLPVQTSGATLAGGELEPRSAPVQEGSVEFGFEE